MPRTRISQGDYYADVITDWRGPQPFFVYVVQRYGRVDVLAMGCCASEEEALEFAADAMNFLRAKAATA